MANKPQPNFEFCNNYGENYKRLRTDKGLTQKELAKALNIVHSTISDIEKSKNPPTIEQLQAYHKYFGVSYEYLLGETKAQSPDIQMICEYTGLSEAAVKRLRHIWHKDYNDFGELNDIYLSIVSDMIVHGEFEEVLQLIHVTKSRRDNAGNTTDDNEEEQVKRILEENRDMLYAEGYLFVHKDKYDRMMKQEIKDKLGDIANSIIDK